MARILLLCVVALATSGCAFQTLESNLAEVETLGAVVVDVVDQTDLGKPILVSLTDAKTHERVNFDAVYGSGRVLLSCAAGSYHVSAFVDVDEDLAFREGEPVCLWGDPSVLVVAPGAREEVSLRLDVYSTVLTLELREWLETTRRERPELVVRSTGMRASLDDERFDRKYAKMGGWEPAEFLKLGYLGIHLLQDYDPNRTPVLFVHGIMGTPTEFREIIDGLDAERFQPWVYYYPSAFRLDDIGKHLFKEMNLLYLQHRPEKIILVAHSMGGLVARRAVAEYLASGAGDYLCSFVTVASPLGGMRSAGWGARLAPTPMPCWYDLAPESPFLAKLFETPLPDALAYHMFFAFEEEDSDGVVKLKSQLREEALDQASTLHGVDASHVGILSHARTLRALASIFEPDGLGATSAPATH